MRKTEFRIAVVVLGTMFLAGCNVVERLRAPDDQAITSAVQAKLFEDSVLKTRDIHVTSQKGVVTLTGTVGTELEKGAAERMAGQVNGVKQVIDQLTVSQAAAAPAPGQQEAQAAPSPAPPAERAAPERPASEHSRPSRRQERASHAAQPAPAPAPADTPAPAMAQPAPAEATAAPAPAPPQPQSYTIPAGTVITVRMIDSIDSSRNHAGDEFAATVDAPIAVGNQVIIPRNSDAHVRLVQAQSAGRMRGRSELEVTLIAVSVGGMNYPVETAVIQKQGASRGTRTAETVGGGAGIGALIGAIAGHGKGAAIGAAVGAGAGTAVQASTKGQQIKIPSETKLDFTLKTPITVTM
jgi:ribosomal protein L12E/L44/L45/RPP1/RPP2